MESDFKIIEARAFDGNMGFQQYSEYYRVDKTFTVPDSKIILIAPKYKSKAFTLNFYKVVREYDSNGVSNMIIDGHSFDKLVETAIKPFVIANIDIDFYVNICKEKERLFELEKELKKATKDISFYMQLKTLSEMSPERYGPLVDEWKKLSFKDNSKLLDTDDNKSESGKMILDK